MTTPAAARAKTKTMEERIEALREKRATVEKGGGTKRIEKQHAQGKLTARERVEKLVDPAIVPGDWRLRDAPGDAVRNGRKRASGRRRGDRMRAD